jgi:chromate transporter
MTDSTIRIKELAKLFLKLGIIGFGGPAAHIAMMQNEVVTKKKWMNNQDFLDLIGATNLIPGPNSTEMAIHIGHERAGWKGLLTAGLCFILPAVLITGFFAWLYKEYGQLPELQDFIYGIKPAIIAIILGAIFPLAKKSVKTIHLALIGILTLVLSLLGYNEIGLLFGSGFLALFLFTIKNKSITTNTNSFFPFLFIVPEASRITIPNIKLFLIFLKIGAILYGSGYVLFAFLDSELVGAGILSRNELIDAIAVGQFTPGPVFSSVTFIGYQINGIWGAVIATIAIFLPSFLFVALLNPLVKKARNSKMFSVFLDAVNVASIAIIIAVCFDMGKTVIIDWKSIFILFCAATFAFGFKKINSAFIVLGGATLGYLLSFI